MKKKNIWIIVIYISAVALIAGTILGVRIYQREQDPYWQLAKKLCNVESALQEIDKDWKVKSLTKVTPFCYQKADGTAITYYCCTTTYVGEAPSEYFGIDQAALEQVVDMDELINRRNCEVNGLDAVIGELEGQTYLCWTLSPTYSCVIEYTTGTITEDDLFRMAESVPFS